MNSVTLNYAVAVYASWGTAVALLALFVRKAPSLWHDRRPVRMDAPGRELLWGLAAAAILMVLSVGLQGLLNDLTGDPRYGDVVYFAELIIIYSPLALMMAWRRQQPETVFLRFDRLLSKIVAGFLLSLVGAAVFLLIRGRIADYPAFLATLGRGGPVAMLQTFLEGFVVGYLLYRFGAWKGIFWASTVVAVLFLAGHLPNYMSDAFDFSLPGAVLFAGINAGVGVLILLGIWESQDIISFGLVHWFINAASSFTT